MRTWVKLNSLEPAITVTVVAHGTEIVRGPSGRSLL
jgi:hypothetical protein